MFADLSRLCRGISVCRQGGTRIASLVYSYSICLFIVGVVLSLDSISADERQPHVEILRPGVRLSLVAEHPILATPTGIDVDEQGRIWVVATHTHMRPDDYEGPQHDEILVLTAPTTPGGALHRQVFYNATDTTMDLELGPEGWVYLAERSRIVRIKDTTGDGRADVEEPLAVLHTEAVYPHNGLAGLAWHPEGDLIFGLGENFAKPWKLTGADGKTIPGAGKGGIFRCRADGTNLRRIAEGFWNPFGACVREDGEMFVVDNDPGERPPCRLLHIVPGGDYGYERGYGSEAHHPFVGWNGELRGTLPMIHPSAEAPCAVLPLGRGLLVPSWSDHRIDFHPLTRQGATYASDPITLLKGGRYFRPTCLAAAPTSRGSQRVWYLCDWVDGRYPAHGYGRLWKLVIDLEQADWIGPLDLEPPTEQAILAERLRHPEATHSLDELLAFANDKDPFLAQAALLALARQAPEWTADEVVRMPSRDRILAMLALKQAGVASEDWLKHFLADNDPDIQFEALRWISDHNITALLPDVERLLSQSDLDYRRFEAAIATWNTLQGTPEAGIRNPALLLAKVQDSQSPPRLRAYALRLLPTQPRVASAEGVQPTHRFPEGLTLDLLQELLDVHDATLSLEVLRTLASNPGDSQSLLARVATDSEQSVILRAEAVAGLAAVVEEQAELLLQLASSEERAIREEALRSLRSIPPSPEQIRTLKAIARQHPDSSDLVEAALNPESLTSNRPEIKDTQAWLQLLDEVQVPADIEAGRRIFHHSRLANCAHCHRHSGRGNVVGPDLSSVGNNKDRDWLLKSILDPSAEMAPEYQPRTIILNDGRTFTGIRLRSSTSEVLRDAHGQNRSFNRGDIDSMIESPVSFMPSGLVNRLTNRELKDLLAFLQKVSPQ